MAPYRSETSWPVERGSPTKLTNYYEDVEAPRVFREPSSRAPTVLAAEHFADRRRPRKQMGKFVPTSPSTISMASRQLRQQVAEQARRRRQQSSSSRSTGPSTDDVVRGCVRGTFSVGRHMTQCLITTADVYQQECTTTHQHRGEDSIFLTKSSQDQTDYTYGDDNSVKHQEEEEETTVDEGIVLPPDLVNVARDTDERQSPDQEWEGDQPFSSRAGRTFPEPSGLDEEAVLVTPRVQHRSTGLIEPYWAGDGHFQLPIVSPPPRGTFSEEREFRLDMFRRNIDHSSGRMVPETMYTLALKELNSQVDSMKKLQSELDGVKEELVIAKKELHAARDQSVQRNQASAASSEKIFKERVEIEEKLRLEIKKSEKLAEQISKLQEDNMYLKSSLRSSKLEAAKRTPGTSPPDALEIKGTLSFPPAEAVFNAAGGSNLSAVVMSLRADVVDLKAQLAEARAARLSAEQSKSQLKEQADGALVESARLREQVAGLRLEVAHLKRQSDDAAKQSEAETQRLQDEIAGLKDNLAETKSEVDVQSRRGQQLEEELTETQADATRLRRQVADFLAQLEKTKKMRDEVVQRGDEEARRLQSEVKAMKDKLAKTNAEVVAQAAEHLKERKRIEEELIRSKAEATLHKKAIVHENEALQLKTSTSQDQDDSSLSGIRRLLRQRRTGGI